MITLATNFAPPPLSIVIGATFFLGGLGWMWAAFRARARRAAVLRSCIQVRGEIIRVEDTTTDGDSISTWTPVAKYRGKTEGGETEETFEVELEPQTDSKKFRVGSKVPVFFERGNPRNAITVRQIWDMNLFCTLSVLLTLFGAGTLWTLYQEFNGG